MSAMDGIHGLVVIGASAGGVEAMTKLAADLQPDLPYAYLMVRHIPSGTSSVLAHIVDRAGPLPATPAVDGDLLRQGHIYVGVPDRHLLIDDHRQILSHGPTENGHRPAINALFRSAALNHGPRTIGVLMSGVLDDGVAGMRAIKTRGGTTIAQSPSDALFPDMPTKALGAGVVDHQATAADMGALLATLSTREIEERDEPRPGHATGESHRDGTPLRNRFRGPGSQLGCPRAQCTVDPVRRRTPPGGQRRCS
jgi:two-component system chemotaxis response regulator CheB